MPITIYEVGDALGGYLAYEGRIGVQDNLAVQAALRSLEASFRRWMFALLDYSALEMADHKGPDMETVARGAQRLSALTRAGFVVAIAAPQSHMFGLGRMWQTFSEEKNPWETRVVNSYEEADRWIRARVKAKFGVSLDRPVKALPLTRLAAISETPKA